jgi:enoyl-CoA hydratase
LKPSCFKLSNSFKNIRFKKKKLLFVNLENLIFMEYSTIKFEQFGGVGILTITRPEALNALNNQFFNDFNNFLQSPQLKNEIRVLIITGEGKAFVAGADIAEMQKMNVPEGYDFSKKGQDAFGALENLEIPVIAAVNGFALGGGCELAMACDFRIASSKAKLGLPEVSLGLIPGYGGTQRLARLIGLGNALSLTLTGQIIDAHEAYRLGLVQKLFEPEFLLDEVKIIAEKIAQQGPNAVKAAKMAIRNGFKTDIDKGFDIESSAFSKLFEQDGVEGMKAFIEKRKPEWK